MKKILSLALALIMCCGAMFSLSSCSKPNPAEDLARIQKKGTIVIGCTPFEPMNYEDENGKLIGFDTEVAELVAQELGIKVKFRMITWSKKYLELEAGKIDCIWNGFTSNSSDDGVARADRVDFSMPYATNYQCIVVKKENREKYSTLDSLKNLKCAVEGGSAGEDFAKTLTSDITKKDAQVDAFTDLLAGKVEFIVVDVLLANRKCEKGDFGDIVKGIEITDNVESYGIGFRKGSTLTAKVDEILVKLKNEGKLDALAAKYGVPLAEIK